MSDDDDRERRVALATWRDGSGRLEAVVIRGSGLATGVHAHATVRYYLRIRDEDRAVGYSAQLSPADALVFITAGETPAVIVPTPPNESALERAERRWEPMFDDDRDQGDDVP